MFCKKINAKTIKILHKIFNSLRIKDEILVKIGTSLIFKKIDKNIYLIVD